MLLNRKRFSGEDIGADLLPIITRGIYRDPLDTLREYVQNAIDASARNIEVAITSDFVSVRDNGTGMTREVAGKAIRLGISEKNPKDDVGFRGIGIYSAFNTCKKLEIYTRPSTGAASKIVFDFEAIRDLLKTEEDRRIHGGPSSLYLEKLLSGAVWVEDCPNCPLAASGTLVTMVGVSGSQYKRLTDAQAVKDYLEGVVPLPFPIDFPHRAEIGKQFAKEDYRVVPLKLSINDNEMELFRPYTKEIFTHSIGYGPKFFTLSNVLSRGQLGFAWVCLNDARKYLPAKPLRGLLIRKFGFSVGGRDYFSKFFSRAVFNNRITGEIIITNKGLLPNAARTEFEPGPLRDSLDLSLADLASEISTWANEKQEELKATEELEIISPEVFRIVKQIPEIERDVPRLLLLNSELTSYHSRLKTHQKTLHLLNAKLYSQTIREISQAQQTITTVLQERNRRGASARRQRIEDATRAQEKAPQGSELLHAADRPQGLLEVIEFLDMEVSAEVQLLLEFLDKEVLHEKCSEKEYSELIANVLAYLEENI